MKRSYAFVFSIPRLSPLVHTRAPPTSPHISLSFRNITLNVGGFMKKAKDIQIGERVWDRGRSFVVKEIHVDRDGLISFIDTEGIIRGPYVPDEFLGVNQECVQRRDQFEILKQFASPEEKQAEEERELHNDGYCEGAPMCWLCEEEKERLQELEAKACACGHQKERHYWTKRNGEYVHLCRECRECLGFEKPDPENGFTVEEIQSRWAYERRSREANGLAAVHLEPLREALRIKTVNFMLDAVFAPGRRTVEK
jgi:hypothetical protein